MLKKVPFTGFEVFSKYENFLERHKNGLHSNVMPFKYLSGTLFYSAFM